MNWHQDPRIQKLLKKATLESLIKCYFQRVYEIKEITEMENALKNALAKYDKKDLLYEKLIENDAEPLDNECLDRLCEKKFNREQDHTSDTLLTFVKLFIKVSDHQLACEIIWCSASLAIQDRHGALEVKDAFEEATEFIQKLRELQITDELN